MVVLSSLLNKSSAKAVNGIENVTNVAIVPKLWTQSMPVTVLTRMFTVKLVTVKIGDHMVMDLLVDLVSCKLMV